MNRAPPGQRSTIACSQNGVPISSATRLGFLLGLGGEHTILIPHGGGILAGGHAIGDPVPIPVQQYPGRDVLGGPPVFCVRPVQLTGGAVGPPPAGVPRPVIGPQGNQAVEVPQGGKRGSLLFRISGPGVVVIYITD